MTRLARLIAIGGFGAVLACARAPKPQAHEDDGATPFGLNAIGATEFVSADNAQSDGGEHFDDDGDEDDGADEDRIHTPTLLEQNGVLFAAQPTTASMQRIDDSNELRAVRVSSSSLLANEVRLVLPDAGDSNIIVTSLGDVARVASGVVQAGRLTFDDARGLLWVESQTVADGTEIVLAGQDAQLDVLITLALVTPAGIVVAGEIDSGAQPKPGIAGRLEGDRLVVPVQPSATGIIPTALVLYDLVDRANPVELDRVSVASIGSMALTDGVLDVISGGESTSHRQRFDVSGSAFVPLSSVAFGDPLDSIPVQCADVWYAVDSGGQLFAVDTTAASPIDADVGVGAALACVGAATGLIVSGEADARLYDLASPRAPVLLDRVQTSIARTARVFDDVDAEGTGLLVGFRNSTANAVERFRYDVVTGTLTALAAWPSDFRGRTAQLLSDGTLAVTLGRSVLLGDPSASAPEELELLHEVGDVVPLPNGAAWIVHPALRSVTLRSVSSTIATFDHMPANADEAPLAEIAAPFASRLITVGSSLVVAVSPSVAEGDAQIVVVDVTDVHAPIVRADTELAGFYERGDVGAAAADASELDFVVVGDLLVRASATLASPDTRSFVVKAIDLRDPSTPLVEEVMRGGAEESVAALRAARDGDLWLGFVEHLAADGPGHPTARFKVQRLHWDETSGLAAAGPSISVPGRVLGEAADGSLVTEDLRYDENFAKFYALNRVTMDDDHATLTATAAVGPNCCFRFDGENLVVHDIPFRQLPSDVEIFDATTLALQRVQRWPTGTLLRLAPRRALLGRQAFQLLSRISLDIDDGDFNTVPESTILYRAAAPPSHTVDGAFFVAGGFRGAYRILLLDD